MAPQKGVKEAVIPAARRTRARNARELRAYFIEIQESPDGAEPDPLTVPKVVECSHCQWPVYPRECKVATKKTFARAGIQRGSKKDQAAKKAPGAEPEGEDEPENEEAAESDDSRDTTERLVDEVEELTEKVEQLKQQNDELTETNGELTAELQSTKEELEKTIEKVEFLEEAEQRWRDKVVQIRASLDKQTQAWERASCVAADREGGLVKTILELRETRKTLATVSRRRARMLAALEAERARQQAADEKQMTLHLWAFRAMKDKLTRDFEQLELRRRNEVGDLQQQLHCERARVAALEANVERLEGRMKEAAQRLLERSLGAKAWPSASSHAFRTWTGTVPLLITERILEETRAELKATQEALAESNSRAATLLVDLQRTTKERDELQKLSDDLTVERNQLAKDLSFYTDPEVVEAQRRAAEEHEAAWDARLNEVKRKLQKKTQEAEKLQLLLQATESRLAVTELALEAASSGGGGGSKTGGGIEDYKRVVPRGTGVMCVGCLKQLLHRSVKTLPPKVAMSQSAAELNIAKRSFFAKELDGSAAADDAIHTQLWMNQKDPYGMRRLTVPPDGEQAAPESSPKSSPKGLPSLQKRAKMAIRDVDPLEPLRASIKEFRKGFR